MYYKLIFVLAFLMSNLTLAQFGEHIRTGRPGRSIGPFTVGKNILQTQTGFEVGVYPINVYGFRGYYIYPNTVLRFGITELFEINGGLGYRKERLENALGEYEMEGINLSALGVRFNILNGENFSPSLGFQMSLKFPRISSDFSADNFAPKMLLIVRQKLSDRLALFINKGIDYNGNNAKPVGIYVINFSYMLNTRYSTFIEVYGDYSGDHFYHHYDTGFSYLLNNDFQIDLYGGIGKNEGVFSYFTSTGISWRFTNWYTNNLNK